MTDVVLIKDFFLCAQTKTTECDRLQNANELSERNRKPAERISKRDGNIREPNHDVCL
jgi:hypothetical protein